MHSEKGIFKFLPTQVFFTEARQKNFLKSYSNKFEPFQFEQELFKIFYYYYLNRICVFIRVNINSMYEWP